MCGNNFTDVYIVNILFLIYITNIKHITTSVSWLNILCIKFKIRINCSLHQSCSNSFFLWWLTFYTHVENTCTIASFHWIILYWDHKTRLLKCLYQVRKVNSHVYLGVSIVTLFLRLCSSILNCSDIVVFFITCIMIT